ncbi:MAG: helix-turn-helix domain-containing protein [Oscillospiraceae bacterium]|nr:helix-turn-helix transcriptional regulator [Oscillospiraceae bacterium]
MFINKASSGKNNLCGEKVALLRKEKNLSQRALAEKLQLFGLNVDKNAVQRIEAGLRFVTDIELVALKNVLEVSYEELLS